MALEAKVGPSIACFSIKESCVNPSRQDPKIGDSDKCGLYVDENPPYLVALGRLYEGSTTVHNIPLGNNQVKIGVEEVRDADAHILVPTQHLHCLADTSCQAFLKAGISLSLNDFFPIKVFTVIKLC